MSKRSSIVFTMVMLLLFNLYGQTRADPEEDSDDEARTLAEQLPSLEESDKLIDNFKALRKKHGTDEALFAAYNRFTDASKADGEQALGYQEVRALLKDVGLGNYAIRGELAKLAIRGVDSSGDGRVSQRELAAALNVADCWIDGSRADPAAEMIDVLHTCSESVRAWWRSGWATRLETEERRLPLVREVLALPSAQQCEAALLERSYAHAKRESSGGAAAAKEDVVLAGHTALRKSLKLAGVGSLLLRHLWATMLIEGLDADADRRLSAAELALPISLSCEAYGAVVARGTSATAVVRAFSLPASSGGFAPAAYTAALGSDQAAAAVAPHTLELARTAVAGATATREEEAVRQQPFELGPSAAVAIAATYVLLAPEAALRMGVQDKDEV